VKRRGVENVLGAPHDEKVALLEALVLSGSYIRECRA
jgi:hypothetical protein